MKIHINISADTIAELEKLKAYLRGEPIQVKDYAGPGIAHVQPNAQFQDGPVNLKNIYAQAGAQAAAQAAAAKPAVRGPSADEFARIGTLRGLISALQARGHVTRQDIYVACRNLKVQNLCPVLSDSIIPDSDLEDRIFSACLALGIPDDTGKP
jgi:hypothetical protein